MLLCFFLVFLDVKPTNIVQIIVDRMDRRWLRTPLFTVDHVEGVRGFMNFIRGRFSENDIILCPCRLCLNLVYAAQNQMRHHLLEMGMDPMYPRWIHHGEPPDAVVIVHDGEVPDADVIEQIDEDSDNDAASGGVNHAEKFDADVMEETAEEPSNDADIGRMNGAEEFVADSGGVSHADFMEQTAKEPVNDADQSEELFANL